MLGSLTYRQLQWYAAREVVYGNEGLDFLELDEREDDDAGEAFVGAAEGSQVRSVSGDSKSLQHAELEHGRDETRD